MRWLADLAYFLAGFVYLPVVLYHAIFLKKNRRGWGQRFGAIRPFDPAKKRVWIHAVSLGEINATPSLVAALKERLPDADFVFSTTTDTGFARAVQYYGADRVFRFPVDFSFVISRVLERVQPSMIVLVELEVWYNLVRRATRRGVPVVVVNGRLTERSHRRLSRVGALARPMFADLAWVGAQDDAIAARFKALGTRPDRVEVTSSLKWDTAEITDKIEGAVEIAHSVHLTTGRPIWVCGSTGPGEEEQILDAYANVLGRNDADPRVNPPLQLVIAPRKPERFDEVARLIESRGFACIRRSAARDGVIPAPRTDRTPIVLVDTLGDLRKLYALASFVFVGRTLVPLGGSDPMEVAALAKPIILGPYFDNFESPVRALEAADAVRIVRTIPELAQTVIAFVDDPSLGHQIGRRGREVVIANRGATARTADKLAVLFRSAFAARGPYRSQPTPSATVLD